MCACSVVSDSCDSMDGIPPGPQSMGFSRREYWSGLPFLTPGDLPNPAITPEFPALQVNFFFFLPTEPLGKPMETTDFII